MHARAIPRLALALAFLGAVSPQAATAQDWFATASYGRYTYGAGGDQGYPMGELEIGRSWGDWTTWTASYMASDIGPRNLARVEPGWFAGNETVRRLEASARWRLGGLLATSSSGERARIDPWIGASASLIWSQGRLLITEQVTDELPPEDVATIGPGVGLSAGLDVGVVGPLFLSGGVAIYQDFMLGTSLTDYQSWIGLGGRW